MMQQCLQLIAVTLTIQNLVQVHIYVSFQQRMRYTEDAVFTLRELIFFSHALCTP